MIKSITLKNWKSFSDSTLWVDPLTFVIGTNSAGKSNIVDALGFLASSSLGKRISDILLRGGAEGIIRRKQKIASLRIVISCGSEDLTYEISVSFNGKELVIQDESLMVNFPSGKNKILFYSEKVLDSSNQITVNFLDSDKNDFRTQILKRETSILSQVTNLPISKIVREACEKTFNTLSNIFIIDPKPEMMRTYTKVTDHLSSDCANIAGVIAGLPGDKKKYFEDTLTEYVRPLPEKDLIRIWSETVGLFKTDAMLYCAEEWVDGEVVEFDARSMSDGTLRFIAVVTALLSADAGSTLVIEEVDNGLHPSRAGELVLALKQLGVERGVDIICTTHNPVLIDALGPEMLPFISYVSRSEYSGTSEIKLLEDTPHLLKLLANYTPGGLMTKGYLNTSGK